MSNIKEAETMLEGEISADKYFANKQLNDEISSSPTLETKKVNKLF